MKQLLFLICTIAAGTLMAQPAYWQQQVDYTIDVELNDAEKSITGTETLVYKNNSPQTLDFIWFHIWPNAYKQESTALFQQLKADAERQKKLEKYTFGHISGLDFKVNGQSARTEAHPAHIDIIKLLLPQPLAPGAAVTITTPFVVQLPSYFSRSGYADGQYMLCQWYPKPAVYDAAGWHEMPYLDMGEFYSEYGSFTVNITLPSAYVVGATGVLQTAAELEQYKTIGRKNTESRSLKKPALYQPGAAAKKTLQYRAENVPDFAWFADKDFVVQYDTVHIHGGGVTDAFSYYHNKKESLWNYSIDYVKDAVRKYSHWVGAYPYPVVQAVEGPKNNSSGGMEYPMITLITSPDANSEHLDAVIAHEVGHNWFMCVLGSNERVHGWQDEGMNSYYQFRYEAEKYRGNSIFGNMLPKELKKKTADEFLFIIYSAMQGIPMQPAIETPATGFRNSEEYGMVTYLKAAIWMYKLEQALGRETFDKAMQHYFNTWKFKHPRPADLKAALETATGQKLDELFGLLNKEGKL